MLRYQNSPREQFKHLNFTCLAVVVLYRDSMVIKSNELPQLTSWPSLELYEFCITIFSLPGTLYPGKYPCN